MEKQKNVKLRKYWVIPLFIALLSALIISNLAGDFLFGIFSGFLSSLTPILIGMFIIFLLKHLMDYIEQHLLKNHLNKVKNPFAIKRTISIILSFLLLFLVIFIIINMIVPRVIEIGTELFNNREQYIYQIKSQLNEFIVTILPNSEETITSFIDGFAVNLGETVSSVLPKIIEISTSTFLFLGQFMIGILLAFLYLKDKEKIREYSKRIVRSKINEEKANNIFAITQKSDKILLDYSVGKFLEAGVLIIGIGITLAIMDVRYAFELALIISLLNFIPYIGFIISLVPTTLITIIYGSVSQAITVLIVLIIVFTILTTFVTPYIVGKKIKVNLLLMLIAMVIGGGMFGMFGMIFAPPIVAILSVISNDNLTKREKQLADEKASQNIEDTNNVLNE